MNSTTSTPAPSAPDGRPSRALVLGGGGAAGNAWLIGTIAGLFDGGLDATGAGLTIGTSAGATAAAQITGADPLQLFRDVLSATVPQRSNGAGRSGAAPGGKGRPSPGPALDNMRRTGEVIAASSSPEDMRRRMGASALGLKGSRDDTVQARWRATVASRLPGRDWPRQRVLITAVNALTGVPVVFDRDFGVGLADAVAASCAGSFAYTIDGTPYIDGGYRRNSENADLAAGCGRVLVLSPLGGRTRHPLEWGMQLDAQVDELIASGSEVETLLPDGNSLAAFAGSMMDLSTRPAAARAGFEQGKAAAVRLAGFWG